MKRPPPGDSGSGPAAKRPSLRRGEECARRAAPSRFRSRRNTVCQKSEPTARASEEISRG